MFEEIQKQLTGVFGQIKPGQCRIGANGKLAIKCSDGSYKTYDVKNQRLTNVTGMCFDFGNGAFFLMPTTKVEVGDVILLGTPKCVTKTNGKTITVLDYETGAIQEIVPQRHLLFGSAYFYGKIVSLFGNMFKGGKGGLGNIMKLTMFQQLMSGGSNNMNANGGIGQLMALSMMGNLTGGGSNNLFEGMFDGLFDFDAADALNGDAEDEEGDTNAKDAE